MNLITAQVSSLEKIFLDTEISKTEYEKASILKGEEFAYQIAYSLDKSRPSNERLYLVVEVTSPLKEYISIYDVGNAPSELPAYPDRVDDDYITTKSGLFPDILNTPINGNIIKATVSSRAIWISFKGNKNTDAGIYPITISFKSEDNQVVATKTLKLEIIDAHLPEQRLIYTQWFHGDCIATYYGEEIFSESHWKHMERFIETASENGINMLLTPIFTPPLDTKIGGERPTIQLVDVAVQNGVYSFNFDKLKRWIDICRKHGIKYFEMSHLFTQWGAKSAPKIMATVDGEYKKLFGWDTPSTSKEYTDFLGSFLPCLTEFLKGEGIEENTYFHISDEPAEKDLDSYVDASKIAKPYLKGFKIIDALSDYAIYKTGVIEKPIPSNDRIEPFLGIKGLWTYYCCAQTKGVSNRFFAMPSYRNRIIGTQLFKYDIEGFLHWGYNFYYTQHSIAPINPYLTTDAYYAFPSGDAFSVYPGSDGKPVESIRLKIFKHALQDLSAMELLADLTSKELVIDLIDSQGEIAFDKYPKSADYILSLREKINHLIKENI